MNWSIVNSGELFNPWSTLQRLQQEMGELFDGYEGSSDSGVRVNIWADEEKVTVEAAIPGARSEDLELSVKGNALTLRGERPAPELPKEARFIRRERALGRFAKSIELPYAVEADKVQAKYENGILFVQLPRSDSDKPRTIKIN